MKKYDKQDNSFVFTTENLDRIAFPMGGIGAGMVALEGTGALTHLSLRHQPEIFNEPLMFAALQVQGVATARVLEGAVPKWKAFGPVGTGNGGHGKNYGLPRFANCTFSSHFPFAQVALSDTSMPLSVTITGWSPFIPGDADSASMPLFALEYKFCNDSQQRIAATFSFHATNFMAIDKPEVGQVSSIAQGFIISQPSIADNPAAEGSFAVQLDHPETKMDCAWFRGGWFDSLTMLWNRIQTGEIVEKPEDFTDGGSGGGASIYLPFELNPGEELTLRLRACWYIPYSDIRCGYDEQASENTACSGSCCGTKAVGEKYRPWYSTRFSSIDEVVTYWQHDYQRLLQESKRFSDCFYDNSLPVEVTEAIAANLTILKSPTCLRQADGRFWAWEGCCDASGCCHGSCTHVWNYAQALAHLFPELERSMRETEFLVNQDERGHQNFRTSLPIRPPDHLGHAAADGQLGGLMKIYRDWRISGDTAWMLKLWPQIKASIDYAIATWDPVHCGNLLEPHHNTYDIEFWGADGMCSSFYLGALAATVEMGKACGAEMTFYRQLLKRGRERMESELWNGEYFYQKVQWQDLKAGDPVSLSSWSVSYSPEAQQLMLQEGPKYQYGSGCLADGVLGDWIARCCGLKTGLHDDKIKSHLSAVFKYNFREVLSDHANPQRPTYALGDESGLILCSWPRGGKPSLPFVYSDEVWTGLEYQLASHLVMMGEVEPALTIIRALRSRYNGKVRNPYNEYECGHWYARALASYGLLQAFSGARYDAVEQKLYFSPAIEGDFHCFIATAGGYGTVGREAGKPFLRVVAGNIPIREIIAD